jgi:hypothetical protein
MKLQHAFEVHFTQASEADAPIRRRATASTSSGLASANTSSQI